jgi:cytochrome c5
MPSEANAKSQSFIERNIMRIRTIFFSLVLILILGMALTACSSKSTTQAPSSTATVALSTSAAQAPSGTATVTPSTGASDGQALMNERCTKCHNLDRVKNAKKTADEWKKTVTRMISNGAKLTSDEQIVLLDYLAKTYHK